MSDATLLRKLKAKSKIWIELEGTPVFGDGKARLLSRVASTGSLRAAATAISMSYRAAWGKIRKMEKRLGHELLDRRTGGRGGGHSRLTPFAILLLGRYRMFRRGLDAAVDRKFSRLFRRRD